jgi:four helix bundle protein
MTYKRFEDLPVWQEAIRLAEAVYDLLEANENRISFSFRDQLERATLSVSNNIAEGFERGTTAELLSFIYIARGSAGEVRSMLCLLHRRPKWANLKSQISNLRSLAESCSRQLRAWAESLQNSDVKGPRHLNNKVRLRTETQRRAAAMQQKLLANLPANHPLRRNSDKI